jgi:SAM-dependent methyltransferase
LPILSQKTWSAFDLAEGFFLAHAFSTVERLGVLESLKRPLPVRDLAAKHHIDEYILDATLQMLAARTPFVRYQTGKYKTTSDYNSIARFIFLQYVGSYGPNARGLAQILRNPSAGCRFVDREQHKRAFEQARTPQNDALVELVGQLGFHRVLDIGCGTANMLLRLASRREDFTGWGIDSNPWMCAAARRRIATARESRRIKILHCDSRDPQNSIPPAVVDKVEALTATGIANEFFGDGISGAVAWLAKLKAVFPGRTMLIADYYGQLGFKRSFVSRGVALHDFVQVISGQGVPPPDLAGWKRVYQAARCKLIHKVEEADSPNFLHVLKL